MLRVSIFAVCVGLLVFPGGRAVAAPAVGVGVGAAKAVGSGSDVVDVGVSVAGRVGGRIAFPSVVLEPGLAVVYTSWGWSPDVSGIGASGVTFEVDRLTAIQIMPGVRLGALLGRIEPSVDVRVGYARMGSGLRVLVPGSSVESSSARSGFTVAVGGTIDVSVSHGVAAGLFVDYDHTSDVGGSAKWVAFGARLSFRFSNGETDPRPNARRVPERVTAGDPVGPRTVIVRLKRGGEVRGTLIAEEPGALRLRDANGVERTIAIDDVRQYVTER